MTRNIQRTLPQARIVATPLPLCPEIRLYLIDPDNMQRAFAIDEIQTILTNTPYWTFCWASGQALACYLLQYKARFAGRRILDFGAGSGIVAIAAAMAGAAKVIACDIDLDALEAVRANAALNQVDVETCADLAQLTEPFNLIIAADVLYDRENFHYLQEFLALAPEILVADSRVKSLDLPPYRKIAELTATTLPDLDEPGEFRRIGIYRAG
ncbi:MAG: 50S ribosomal protein L11 methyltransferase [Candidatus Competibacteraceae bacterium]